MEKEKLTNQQIKRNKIGFLSLIIFVIIGIGVIYLSDPPTLKSANSISDAKKAIDYYLKDCNDVYKSLCKEPRNDNLKSRFNNLKESVGSMYNCGKKCIKLSYSEQNEVSKYALQKLKQSHNLSYLDEYGKIECW
jgi:hypothetical protein